MPSRSGVYSTRRSAALLVWRASMLTGWWRSRQVRALARKRAGTRSPAGHPRAGLGASGSRKCASSAGRPGRVQAGGFVDDDPGVLPGDRPGLQGVQGQRQRRCQGLAFGQEGAGGSFADGQDTGDLGDQRHFLDGVFLRGRRRGCQGPGRRRVVGGQPHLQRRGPGLEPGDAGERVQAAVRQNPQRISVTQRVGAGRLRPVGPGAGEGSKHSGSRGEPRPPGFPPCFPHSGCPLSIPKASQDAPTIMTRVGRGASSTDLRLSGVCLNMICPTRPPSDPLGQERAPTGGLTAVTGQPASRMTL